jgi:predicted lipid-binding transport protein (Tim44 family)
MEGNFPFLEIVLFAMVAGFLILRLRSVLGRRTGNERRRPDPITARTTAEEAHEREVNTLPERARSPAPEAIPAAMASSSASVGVEQIKSVDHGFDPDHFILGAKRAFEMIVQAFAKGDSTSLRPLLSDEVFAQFDGAIKAREDAKQTLTTTLVGIREAEIVDAALEGRIVRVTVKFVSEQINVTRDSEGRVVDGDPTASATVTDIWTFARNTSSRDPNWNLVATLSPA